MTPELEARLDQMMAFIARHFEAMEARFDRLEERMERLEARVDRLEVRVDEGFIGVAERFTTIELRLQQLEDRTRQGLQDLHNRLVPATDELRASIAVLGERLGKMEDAVFTLNERFDGLSADMRQRFRA